MAIPNIVNVATIHAETIVGDLSTTLTTTLVTGEAEHVYKINVFRVNNVTDGEYITEVNKFAKNSKDVFLSSKDDDETFNMDKNKTDREMFSKLADIFNKHIYLYCLHTGVESPLHFGINKQNFSTFFKDKKDCPEISSNITVDSICLRKYEKNEGGYYWPHYDAKSSIYRLLAAIIYLNDVEYGGETEFPVLKRMVVPKRGNLVIFPANFNYWHYGRSSTSDKYILITHVSKYPEVRKNNKEKE